MPCKSKNMDLLFKKGGEDNLQGYQEHSKITTLTVLIKGFGHGEFLCVWNFHSFLGMAERLKWFYACCFVINLWKYPNQSSSVCKEIKSQTRCNSAISKSGLIHYYFHSRIIKIKKKTLTNYNFLLNKTINGND